MFEKRCLRALNELEKVKVVVKYVSRCAPETLRAKFSTAIYLLTCLVDYVSEERKQ